MKPSFAPILLILAAALSMLWPTSCTPSAEHTCLTHIESIVDDHPDSALTLLRSIDTTAIRSKADRALYAMLLTEALDKNHQALTDDSLISEAIDYFALNGDPRREMIATYYGGRTQYSLGDLTHAIARFFRARELAQSLGENFWQGIAARGIADIYTDSYNLGDALRYGQEEYEQIRKSKKQPYLNYAICDLARMHYNYGNHETAVGYAWELIDSAATFNDSYLRNDARRIIGMHYLTELDFQQAYYIFNEICRSGIAEPIDSTYLCLALSGLDQNDEASALNETISTKDDISSSSIRYQNLLKHNRKDEALKELQKLYSLNLKTYKEKIRNSFSNTAVDYFQSQNIIALQKIKNQQLQITLIVIVSSFFGIVIIFLAIYYIRRKNKRIEASVLFAAQLQEQIKQIEQTNTHLTISLLDSSSEIEKLRRSSQQSKESLTEKSRIIKYLLSSKYELLQNFCNIIIENNTAAAKRKIAETVTSLIRDISINEETMGALEEQINKAYDNLIADLRTELSTLKDEDVRLYIFSVLNFSSAVISMLLKEKSISSIYNRRKRLRAKIRTLCPEKAERYIAFL